MQSCSGIQERLSPGDGNSNVKKSHFVLVAKNQQNAIKQRWAVKWFTDWLEQNSIQVNAASTEVKLS